MNKLWIQTICAAVSLCTALSCCACGKQQTDSFKQSSAAPSTAAPTTQAMTETTAPGALVKEADLSKLFPVASQNDAFAGDWQITEGTGSQLEHFTYRFDGSGTAYIFVGTIGYIGAYSLDKQDGKDVFVTQLMFGLNGAYTYSFSDDKSTVILTNTEDNSTSTLKKQTQKNLVPAPPASAEIDEALLGAWKDENGAMLYFVKNGVSFEEQKGISFFFYTYSAKDGTITQTYSMLEETTDTYSYQIEGDTLTLNDYAYTRASTTEL